MRKILWIVLGGAAAYWVWTQLSGGASNDTVENIAQTGVEDVQAAISGWAAVGEGPTWVPVLNATESQYGIPANLLARMAYQESRFRQDVIQGLTDSSAGARGIMQLEPEYFSTVNVPVPYTAQDTTAQIDQAGQLMQSLYAHYSDWGLAVAAYNDGQGNVDAYKAGTRTLPSETTTYVADVLADVPVPTALQV